jgi:hypothetical protein
MIIAASFVKAVIFNKAYNISQKIFCYNFIFDVLPKSDQAKWKFKPKKN